jgi:hypothetical protein
MKQLFTYLLLLAGGFQAISQPITWGTPVSIYSIDANHNNFPRIALNRSGNPYVIFGQTDTRVYFSKWTGSAFSAPVAVSGALTVFSQSWAGPGLAAYGDTVYVTMKVTPEMVPTAYTYLAHSYNGGSTFSMPMRIDNIGSDASRFPIVTTTSNGNPLVSYMRFDSGSMMNARYMVARSTDYGMTFSSDVLASKSTNPVCDCCPATIISSGSKAIMLHRDNNSNLRDIWAGVSNDGGITFPAGNKFPADTTNWMVSSCPASSPDGFVIGDSLYSVYMSSASGMALTYLSRSSISGMTAANSRITGPFTGLLSQNYPRIDNAGNAAMAVWVQNVGGTKSIAYSMTNNISSGFSGYSTLPGSTSSGIMDADIAMTPGAVHIVWEDDNTGKVMYIKGTYAVTTSTEQISKKETIELYPNPASNDFTVSLNDISSIKACFLTDKMGRNTELKATIKNGKATFSLNGIAKGGYYFIMDDNAGKSYYSKLIVQ